MNYIWLGIAIFIGFIIGFVSFMIGKYIVDIPTFYRSYVEARFHHSFWKSVKIAFIQVKL